MIRVLSIQPVAERGGSDHALVSMIESLPSNEFDPQVVVPDEPPLRDALEAAGAHVHVVRMRRLSRSANLWSRAAFLLAWPVTVVALVRVIRRTGADVVHSNSLHVPYAWAAAWLARVPHVWTIREIVSEPSLVSKVERLLVRRFAAVVVSMSAAIAEGVDPKEGRIFTDQVSSRFRPGAGGRLRRAIGVADDTVLVGSAGRIDTWKGFGVLLDAWSLVNSHPSGNAFHLAICGSPVRGKEAYATTINRRAQGAPTVHMTGTWTDMPSFYTDLDLFVLASTDPEPYGLVIVEALACGVPVIATDHGGPREILGRNSDRGWLVPPSDPEALADAILEAVARGSLHERTSAEYRLRRRSLYRAPSPPWAALFREVAAKGQDRAAR